MDTSGSLGNTGASWDEIGSLVRDLIPRRVARRSRGTAIPLGRRLPIKHRRLRVRHSDNRIGPTPTLPIAPKIVPGASEGGITLVE